MTTIIVSSGQTSSGQTLGLGDVEYVLSGGGTVKTFVGTGAEQIVSAGGTATVTAVGSGGQLQVMGGLALSAVIQAGGLDAVQAGGVASNTLVQAGGTEDVFAGGTVTSSLVSVGAVEQVQGGTAQATTNLGNQYVLSGGQAMNTVNSGLQVVQAGGMVVSTINDGQQFIDAGGSALDTRDLGAQFVLSGGIATSTSVIGSGVQTINTGGTALFTAVSSGGTQVVDIGGVASTTVVASGGNVIVDGGTLLAASVEAIGKITVYAGVTSNTSLYGTESLVGTSGTAQTVRSVVNAGGVLYLGANAIDSASLINAGGLEDIDQGARSTGVVISGGGVLEVRGATGATGSAATGGVVSGATVLSGGELLVFDASPPTTPAVGENAQPLAGFTNPAADIIGTQLIAGGTIDLQTVAYSGAAMANLSPTTDVLAITGAGPELDLQLIGTYTGEYFHLSDDGAGGTAITLDGTPCYCRGTRILTDAGEVPVEALQIGDGLVTRDGTVRPLRWIGRRAYAGRFAAGNRDVLPVLFQAGALGGGLPRRDLYVSPLHAMYLDGALVPAACLVNGADIVQAAGFDSVEYFHLELDSHDVIVAEGALSESYVDDDNRGMFHNAAEHASLYPQATRQAARYCAPRIEDGAALAAIRARLPSSPAPALTAGPLAGHLDVVAQDRIGGWALADGTGAVRLRIVDNGVAIAELTADLPRPDVQAALGEAATRPGALLCGFDHAIAGGLDPSVRHVIQVQRVADGMELPRSPWMLDVPAAAAPIGAPPLRGCLDEADRVQVQGWALAEDGPVDLMITDNGVPAGRVLANRHRADLATPELGDGRCAFAFRFPAPLSPTMRHVIEVRRARDGAPLAGSPLLVEAAGAFDDAMQSAISHAVAALEGHNHAQVLNFLLSQTDRLRQREADAQAGRAERGDFWQFRRRWGPTQPEIADPGRRALVIDRDLPDPDRDAGSRAVLSHMRALQRLGFAVSFVAAEQMATRSTVLAEAGIAQCGAPVYASVEDVLRRQTGCVDLVYLHRAAIAGSYMGLVRRWMPRARVAYAVADLHHLRLARQAEVEQRPELLAQSHRMRLAECTAAWEADVVLTHSPHEADLLRRAVPTADVHVTPWEVPLAPTAVRFARRQGLAFIGNYGHGPNVDAARFLAEEIMPLVWAQEPGIVCHLVGSAMPDSVRALERPGIVLDGGVPDLASIFDRVRLTVAPLRFGAGIKGKVLDSLAAGVPCAMSPIAAEGLDVPARLTGADASSLAAIILRLHGNQRANRAAAVGGLELIGRVNAAAQVDAALGQAVAQAMRKVA